MEGGPIRTCTGCRARRPQDEMIRVVRAPEGPAVSLGKGSARRPGGRGAYVCKDAACVDAALGSGALKRALRYEGDLPAGLHAGLMQEVAEERRGRGEPVRRLGAGVPPKKGADGQT